MGKTRYTYVDGKILPHDRATVRVDNIGLARAYGVYDGIMTYDGEPFAFDDHYTRLRRSAKLLGLKVPVSASELYRIIKELIRKNRFRHPIVRVLLNGGTTVRGIDFNPAKPTLIVLLEELRTLPPHAFTRGVRVITHEYERYIPEAKTINYIAAVRLQPALRKAQATEALYTSHGKILEATTSNLFVVKGGAIITPKDGILNGITRQVTINIAKTVGYKVSERAVTLQELRAADEVFLTSSFKEILPVSHIDGTKVRTSPGPVTQDLMVRFSLYTSGV